MTITRRHLCLTAAKGVVSAAAGGAGIASATDDTVVRYYDQGFSLPLRRYFNDLVRGILQITTERFGTFKLEMHDQRLSPLRTMLEVGKGEILHLAFASSWFRTTVPEESYVELENAFVFDLIGLRSFIARQESQARLAGISQAQQLYKLSVGQGEGWPDSKILQHNGFQVVEGYDLDSLFPMLLKKRFDLIPLSILEAERTLGQYRAQYPGLYVHPQLNLFYPFPFSLFITARRPRLVERFRYGVELALANGTFKRLFSKHFGEVENQLAVGKSRLILAENNLMSPVENTANISRFLSAYGSHFEIIE